MTDQNQPETAFERGLREYHTLVDELADAEAKLAAAQRQIDHFRAENSLLKESNRDMAQKLEWYVKKVTAMDTKMHVFATIIIDALKESKLGPYRPQGSVEVPQEDVPGFIKRGPMTVDEGQKVIEAVAEKLAK